MRTRRVSMKFLSIAALGCICLAMSATAETGIAKKPAPPAAKSSLSGGAAVDDIIKASTPYFTNFPYTTAEEVYEKIVQGGDKSYVLVSVQTAAEFKRGHVPGALNLPLKEIASTKSLKRLPRGKKIVLTCEDGHSSMVAALFLRQLGYEATAMSMGLSHWNATESGISSPYPGSAGYPVSAESVPAPELGAVPAAIGKGERGKKLLIARTKAVLNSGRGLFMDRSEVFEKAVKGHDDRYFLVSVQRPEDYAKGHVPGAINVPLADFSKKETLRKLPRDKKIVLICYIGHSAGSAALFLNQLGYEAYDMRFGTLGWNDTTDGLGPFKEAMIGMGRSMGYPVERGKER